MRRRYVSSVPLRHVRLSPPDGPELHAAFDELRRELDISIGFPHEMLADADKSVRSLRLPDADDTAIPFVTLDPRGSWTSTRRYTSSAVGRGTGCATPSRTSPRSSLPAGRWIRRRTRRGQTLYAPDGNAPLYPPQLSEGAGSLLPNETHPALVWTIEVDETGEGVDVHVRRALVRSRAKLDYPSVQRSLDDGTADEPVQLLREVGTLRQEREARRGGISLPHSRAGGREGGRRLPARVSRPAPRGGLERADLADDGHGRGRAHARRQDRRVADAAGGRRKALARLRRTAKALGVTWGDGVSYADFIRALDANISEQAARPRRRVDRPPTRGRVPGVRRRGARQGDARRRRRLHVRAHDGPAPPASRPLRWRSVRCGVCRRRRTGLGPLGAASAPRHHGGVEPTGAAVRGRNRCRRSRRLSSSTASARRSRRWSWTSTSTTTRGAVQLHEPAVTARCEGKDLPLGEPVEVRLVVADVSKRLVRFELAR